MDIRVLNYFLAVAREGSITKAADSLHITQPTLSRQLMELEEEMGTALFIRGKRQITLTDSGIFLMQRAKEIVQLCERTQREMAEKNDLIGGVVSIGCVESVVSGVLPELLAEFSEKYPMVQYDLYSADGDDIREKIDRGDVDMGILLEPVEAAKYDYIRLPFMEPWGVLMRKDDPLAQKASIHGEEIQNLPLILPRRTIVIEEIARWLHLDSDSLHIVASHNLLTNSVLLIEKGFGYAICIQGAFDIRKTPELRFVPFKPERLSGHVLAWKKNKLFPSATDRFLDYIREKYVPMPDETEKRM